MCELLFFFLKRWVGWSLSLLTDVSDCFLNIKITPSLTFISVRLPCACEVPCPSETPRPCRHRVC